jgi:hypothetical protein
MKTSASIYYTVDADSVAARDRFEREIGRTRDSACAWRCDSRAALVRTAVESRLFFSGKSTRFERMTLS